MKRGDRGEAVRALQQALVALGYDLPRWGADGICGVETIGAAREFAADEGFESPPNLIVIPGAVCIAINLEAERRATRRIRRAAWTGSSSLANPKRDVKLAVELGLAGLYVMVNDHSGSRRPRDFCLGQSKSGQAKKRAQVLELADRCHDAGLEFHVVSWIMPHLDYINGAAEVLVPLCADTRADSLQFDAEEPWTRALSRFGRRLPQSEQARAAEQLETLFASLACPMGATGIGYVSRNGRFAELARRCDYVVPQAYTFGMGNAPAFFFERYRRFFEGREVRLGLRAYPQKLRASALGMQMGRHWDSALETDAAEAIYWSLAWIRRRRQARAFLAGLKAQEWIEGNR